MPEAVKNLLRPRQVQECREELSRLDKMLDSPPHIRSRVDVQEAARRRHRLKAELEDQTPRPYSDREKDEAIKEFHRLGEEIKVGMPSDEVMRRNPPGAVEQHRAWDRRNKNKVLTRKHIGLRLQADGSLDDTLGEAAISVEMLRKRATGFDLAMDGAQIPKQTDFHIPPQPESVVLSSEQIDTLQRIDPKLAGMLALMDADMRSKVKDILEKFIAESKTASDYEEGKFTPTINLKSPDHTFSTETGSYTKAKRPASSAVLRMANLRKLCKANGVNSWGMKTEQMVEALKAKGVAVEE